MIGDIDAVGLNFDADHDSLMKWSLYYPCHGKIVCPLSVVVVQELGWFRVSCPTGFVQPSLGGDIRQERESSCEWEGVVLGECTADQCGVSRSKFQESLVTVEARLRSRYQNLCKVNGMSCWEPIVVLWAERVEKG